MRMTPCESWPHRLASTRAAATTDASSLGRPAASNRDRAKGRRSAALTIGTAGGPPAVTRENGISPQPNISFAHAVVYDTHAGRNCGVEDRPPLAALHPTGAKPQAARVAGAHP